MLPSREDALRGSKKGAQVIKNRAFSDYAKHPAFCLCCGQVIALRDGEVPSIARKKKFCTQSCSATYHNTGRIKVKRIKCLNCGTECQQVHKKFCSHICQQQFQFEDFIRRWKAGEESGISGVCNMSRQIRRYLFEKCGSKCHKCGWAEVHPLSGKIPLQVNHINGNCLDNVEENLELICPNCHSLTPTFGSMNKQVGRRVLLRNAA
jgi:hypothetical protein